jgi:hypothetical protein
VIRGRGGQHLRFTDTLYFLPNSLSGLCSSKSLSNPAVKFPLAERSFDRYATISSDPRTVEPGESCQKCRERRERGPQYLRSDRRSQRHQHGWEKSLIGKKDCTLTGRSMPACKPQYNVMVLALGWQAPLSFAAGVLSSTGSTTPLYTWC